MSNVLKIDVLRESRLLDEEVVAKWVASDRIVSIARGIGWRFGETAPLEIVGRTDVSAEAGGV